ncbi:hypothetical protein A2U01_0081384 [Trifolium medium]|uniref:Uncharacterized protein n=1 Tax=Trifolium medium TaxID=97028 RepID=A0A392TG43_9FABA|nr:hypothetical protein [Trifolium medium]
MLVQRKDHQEKSLRRPTMVADKENSKKCGMQLTANPYRGKALAAKSLGGAELEN